MTTIFENIRAPAVLPVSLLRLHYWMQRDETETVDDQKYTMAIGGAGSLFEKSTDLALVSQRKRWKPWRFGDQNPYACSGMEMKVPFGNTKAVEINYTDTDGISQEFTDFHIEKFSGRNDRIVLDTGIEWPAVYCETYPIIIEFDCGYPVGDIWTPDHAYALGDIMQPTWLMPEWVAYEATAAGTSSGTEIKLSTKTGDVTPDPADTLEWTCLGQSIPQIAAAAILNMAAHFVDNPMLYLDYPNKNEMDPNWRYAVQCCKLQW